MEKMFVLAMPQNVSSIFIIMQVAFGKVLVVCVSV